ncbi:SET domain-containing protein [Caballeronia sordidicola]|uniref:Proteins containing SET protein n=1 Tax=Caballeronia sordidicola TaxID=196367 RepID=A0A226X213_CABSO|nr:SET domain-containing protein-lysine N-methyltransferase [Caballeronia sordidicola]OXC77461.1 Proteins containing SET protein [Caballeronia sordidicola]
MRRFVDRHSTIHGRGVFAVSQIPSGDYLLEYKGELLSARGANRRFARSQVEEGYGFFFGLEGGRIIDGAVGGNSARWMNHSCAPNCEAEQDGARVYTRAIANIEPGDERLSITDSMQPSVRQRR